MWRMRGCHLGFTCVRENMAALVEPVEFSNNGEYLAYSSPDGRLKLWEGTSGKLKQEYTPSAHLSATCTCLSWGPTRHDFVSALSAFDPPKCAFTPTFAWKRCRVFQHARMTSVTKLPLHASSGSALQSVPPSRNSSFWHTGHVLRMLAMRLLRRQPPAHLRGRNGAKKERSQ